jgi:uncharacterized integral membrane protein
MIRLLAFIIIFVVFIAFIVLNLPNKSNIHFGYREFEDIPIFVSVLCSFMLGMLFAIPLSFSLRRKKPHEPKQSKKRGKTDKSGDKPVEPGQMTLDEIKQETGSYGID